MYCEAFGSARRLLGMGAWAELPDVYPDEMRVRAELPDVHPDEMGVRAELPNGHPA